MTFKEFVADAKLANIKIHLAHHFAFHATQEHTKPPKIKRCAKTAQPTGSQTRVANHNVKNVLHLKCLPRDKLFVANVRRAHFWRTTTDFVTDVQVATLLRTARENALSVKQVTLATARIRRDVLLVEQENMESLTLRRLKHWHVEIALLESTLRQLAPPAPPHVLNAVKDSTE